VIFPEQFFGGFGIGGRQRRVRERLGNNFQRLVRVLRQVFFQISDRAGGRGLIDGGKNRGVRRK